VGANAPNEPAVLSLASPRRRVIESANSLRTSSRRVSVGYTTVVTEQLSTSERRWRRSRASKQATAWSIDHNDGGTGDGSPGVRHKSTGRRVQALGESGERSALLDSPPQHSPPHYSPSQQRAVSAAPRADLTRSSQLPMSAAAAASASVSLIGALPTTTISVASQTGFTDVPSPSHSPASTPTKQPPPPLVRSPSAGAMRRQMSALRRPVNLSSSNVMSIGSSANSSLNNSGDEK
jgi:hypothetical protein